MLVLLAGMGFADEHFPLMGQISKGPVNVRSGANTNFEIITKLNQGDKIIVLAKSYEWYKIELPEGSNAYIRADYIKETGDKVGEVTGSKVNVRSKPDSTASVLGQVPQGGIVKLIQKTDEWWQIQAPSGSSAWVHSSFVNLNNETLSPDALRQPLKAADVAPPPVIKKIEKPVLPTFSTKGTLKLVSENVLNNVHYKIVQDGATVCYLEDTTNLEKFKNAVVNIEGVKNLSAAMLNSPVVTVNKISLVL